MNPVSEKPMVQIQIVSACGLTSACQAGSPTPLRTHRNTREYTLGQGENLLGRKVRTDPTTAMQVESSAYGCFQTLSLMRPRQRGGIPRNIIPTLIITIRKTWCDRSELGCRARSAT